MPNYRRAWHAGGTYFFTVNLLERQKAPLLTRHIDRLRQAVRDVKAKHPFVIHGWVVPPDHLPWKNWYQVFRFSISSWQDANERR